MRVLQVHKFFYPHAGSETVLFHTRDLLRGRGHDVMDFAMSEPRNKESRESEYFAPYRNYTDLERPLPVRARDALVTVYSRSARTQMRRLLQHQRPDVAHLHLFSHQLTFSVVDELARQGIPMVATLHDYKIGCPAYVLFRDGAECRDCVTGAVENALLHRCLKGSVAASALASVEARLVRVRHSWDQVDVVVGPSAFVGQVAIDSGMPADRVVVIPNFLPDEEKAPPHSPVESEPQFFFASRLEAVKGVRELLAAFEGDGDGVLVIAGAGGELESDVIAAASRNRRIEYRGRLSRDEILTELKRSRAALVPSVWPENNPMSLLEARAAGVPVIATRVGGLPEMVTDGRDGYLIEAGDSQALRLAIQRLAGDAQLARTLGAEGRRRLERDNAPDRHYEQLIAAYELAADVSARRRAAS